MGEYGALEQCLREGFIDYTVEADQRYVPKILTNNRDKKRKVLDPCGRYDFVTVVRL